eukprot:gene27743-30743_t
MQPLKQPSSSCFQSLNSTYSATHTTETFVPTKLRSHRTTISTSIVSSELEAFYASNASAHYPTVPVSLFATILATDLRAKFGPNTTTSVAAFSFPDYSTFFTTYFRAIKSAFEETKHATFIFAFEAAKWNADEATNFLSIFATITAACAPSFLHTFLPAFDISNSPTILATDVKSFNSTFHATFKSTFFGTFSAASNFTIYATFVSAEWRTFHAANSP